MRRTKDEESVPLPAEVVALSRRAPVPAAIGRVLVGTAGWTDKTLIRCGRFYPRSTLSAAQRLQFYTQHFSMVELDASYYTLLPSSAAQRWTDATPSGFRMSVKAFAPLTGHSIELARLPPDLRSAVGERHRAPRVRATEIPPEILDEMDRRFMALLCPLRAAGRLSSVLFQFPPWYDATRGHARRLELLRERHPDLPISVEFRHASWLHPERRERVFGLLTGLGFSFVAVDEPLGEVGGVPPVFQVTCPRLAVLRMHGRHASGWRRGATVYERFRYLYSGSELAEWLAPVRSMSERAEEVHVVFNNCVQDYAVLGAKGFAALLEGGGG